MSGVAHGILPHSQQSRSPQAHFQVGYGYAPAQKFSLVCARRSPYFRAIAIEMISGRFVIFRQGNFANPSRGLVTAGQSNR